MSRVPIVLCSWCLICSLGCARRDSSPPETPAAAAPEAAVSGANETASEPKPAPESKAQVAAEEDLPSEPPTPELTADEIAEGWIQLFDGISLFGWKASNDVNWSVNGGVIQADTGEPGLLLTAVPFADFELRCDFRLEKGGNSGVFLRSLANPADPAKDCYELNICDTHPSFGTGSFVGRVKPEQPVVSEGEWQTFHVIAEGPRLRVSMNGESLLDYTDESDALRLSGLIGLQKNAGKIEFRRVHLKPLGSQPLFNGQDLAGWRVVPGSKSEFEVVDGAIHATNGPGFLETESAWADFILQAEIRTNGERLNSGIFFRALPGTEAAPSHGYEMQVHNGFKNGDRSEPMDAGTGAIFRRTKARWVIPNDGEWFTATLAAQGPHFTVWVNGIAVTDWTDEREPHENPRQGKRVEAGHFSLQGHDPTTDLSFRNVRVAGENE